MSEVILDKQKSDLPSNNKWETENDKRRNRFTVHFPFISEFERVTPKC